MRSVAVLLLLLLSAHGDTVRVRGKKIKGKVVSFAPGIIVVDVGRDSGVRHGGRMQISRGDSFVGVIDIYEVRKSTAVGRKHLAGKSWPPKAGDIAITDNTKRK